MWHRRFGKFTAFLTRLATPAAFFLAALLAAQGTVYAAHQGTHASQQVLRLAHRDALGFDAVSAELGCSLCSVLSAPSDSQVFLPPTAVRENIRILDLAAAPSAPDLIDISSAPARAPPVNC